MAITISIKAIKPGALGVKKVQQEVQKALEDTGKILQQEFGKTVSGWAGAKPTFEYTTGGMGNRAFVHCYPGGDEFGIQKWLWLDEGTPEHPITPHGNYPLRFPFQGRGQSYSARTRPGYLGSDAGTGEKMGPMQAFQKVNHPGNEAREWSETLGKQEIEPFAERIQQAVDRGLE